jgi:hypothetical protein
LQAPNTIVAKSSGYGIDSSTIIYRDRSRVQAEGQRAWSLLTPGITREVVSQHAPDLTIRTQGMSAVSFEAPPWWDGQPGDRRTLTTAHPTVYDWSAGSYEPATINCVVAAVEHDIYADVFRVRLLLEGRSAALAELCPTARVIRLVSTSELEVESGDELHFEVGDAVMVYQPGDEIATTYDRTIDAIDTDAHIITINSAIVAGTNWHITYRESAACVADQQRRMFVRSDKRWR